MNHGLRFFDRTATWAQWIWELAGRRNDGVAVYVQKALEMDTIRDSARLWKLAHADDLGPLGLAPEEMAEYGYARYMPGGPTDLARMYIDMIGVPWPGIVTLQGESDEPAKKLLIALDHMQAEIAMRIDESLSNKSTLKLAPLLQEISLDTEWVDLMGYLGDDPSHVFLSKSSNIIDGLAQLVERADHVTVDERW